MEHTNIPDKNLINTVKELEQDPVNSHQAQQMQQDKNDRRKEMIKDLDEVVKFKNNDQHPHR